MAEVDSSTASLRIIGDDLDPDAITRALGSAPSWCYRRGDTLGPEGRTRQAKSGLWGLKTDDVAPANLDRQVSLLLEPLSNDLAIWAELASRFRVEIFVGLFSKHPNTGLRVAPETLRLLADRHISMDLDIYGPLQDTSED